MLILASTKKKTGDEVPTAMETMGEHDDLLDLWQTTADNESQTVTERTETQATEPKQKNLIT